MTDEGREYVLELKIDIPGDPVTMVVSSNPVETKEQLDERIFKIDIAITWLKVQRETELRNWVIQKDHHED